MQNVSETYTALLSAGAEKEISVVIDGVRYYESSIMSMSTNRRVFSDKPTIGGCMAGEVEVSILNPASAIPRMASIKPFIRLTDGTQYSEWVPKGEFFIDTRETTQNDDDLDILSIHGYDAMLLAEKDYPDDNHTYPRSAADVVALIADAMGVTVATYDRLTNISVPTFPLGYSCREVLSNIAVLACGNWIMSDMGELLLLPLNDLPEETFLLVTGIGEIITFGGDGIIVG